MGNYVNKNLFLYHWVGLGPHGRRNPEFTNILVTIPITENIWHMGKRWCYWEGWGNHTVIKTNAWCANHYYNILTTAIWCNINKWFVAKHYFNILSTTTWYNMCFMHSHMEIKGNEMYTDDGPPDERIFWGNDFKIPNWY